MLDLSVLKEFANYKTNVTQKLKFVYGRKEIIVETNRKWWL